MNGWWIAGFLLLWIAAGPMVARLQQWRTRGRPVSEADGVYLLTSPRCPFCPPARAPYQAEIASGVITEIDVIGEGDRARAFGLASVPSFVVVRGGRIVTSFVGRVGRQRLSRWLVSRPPQGLIPPGAQDP